MSPATGSARVADDSGVMVEPEQLGGILFDKDGTLIDFRATWVPAFRGVAAELAGRAGGGRALAAELLRGCGYDPASDRFSADSPLLWATNATIAAHWAREPALRALDVLEVVERHFNDDVLYPPRPVGDLPALLGRLRRRGLRLGLATMDSTAQAERTARRLGIAPLLDFVTGADGGFGVKPEPGMVLGFCAACGLAPEQVALVGDTHADLVMARNAGCALAIAVLTGATPPPVLTALADHVLGDVHELEALLDGRIPAAADGGRSW
jgi:phosphoglycolate phosphatase